MYKILIVDDEPYIVDSLSELLENELDMEVDVYGVYSAIDALNWLGKTKMDVLIADICMPVMDGLALAKRVSQTWPHCKVILITGHAEFEYAYAAIRNNVVSYILKTEDDENILYQVKKAISAIKNELVNINIVSSAKQQLREATQVIFRDCFFRMLRGDYQYIPKLKEQNRRLDLKLDLTMPFLTVIGRIDGLPEEITAFEEYEYTGKIENIAEHFFFPNVTGVPVEYECKKIIWFIQPGQNGTLQETGNPDGALWEKAVTFTMGMLELIQLSCKENLNVIISFILSSVPLKYSEFAERFECLEQILYHNKDAGMGALLTDSGFPKQFAPELTPVDNELEKVRLKLNRLDVLKAALENGHKKDFKEGLSDFCELLRKVKSKNNNTAHEIYYSIALMFLSYINRRKLAENLALNIGLCKLTRLEEHTSWNDAVEYLYRLTDIIFDLHKQNQNNVTIDLIAFLRSYVNNHLEQDLSLVRLSEMTGYNPSYLSRLYKNATGENLYEYISKARIDQAKQLLEDTDTNINDIVARVGFQTRICFNRFFRRLAGMSPQEYRSSVRLGK